MKSTEIWQNVIEGRGLEQWRHTRVWVLSFLNLLLPEEGSHYGSSFPISIFEYWGFKLTPYAFEYYNAFAIKTGEKTR